MAGEPGDRCLYTHEHKCEYHKATMKSYLHALTLIIIFSILCSASYGTELIAIARDNWVVFAADSQVSPGDAKPYFRCKIRQTGDLFYMAAGMAKYYDALHGEVFDADNFMPLVARRSGDPSAILDDLGDSLIRPLELVFAETNGSDSDFHNRVVYGSPILTIVAARIRNGSVAWRWKDFKVAKGKVVPQPARSMAFPPRGGTYLFTDQPEALNYWKTHDELGNAPADKIIDTLMQVGKEAHPNLIGGATNILVITPSGASWLPKNKNNCQDVTPIPQRTKSSNLHH